MNDYAVTLVYELFLITTVIWADSEEQAKRWALDRIQNEEGLPVGEPLEYKVEWEGSFVNG